jgi:TRAP-type C4-dicarboxylate transport system permease small subunit
MDSILRKVSRVFESIAVLFTVALFGSVLAQIILRDFFSQGSTVLEEMARYSLVSLVFFMIPVLAYEKRHIIVDIILAKLKGAVRKVFDIFGQVLVSASGIFLLVAISQIMKRNWNVKTPAIRMPNYIFYAPAMLGLLFLVVISLYQIAEILRTKGEAK